MDVYTWMYIFNFVGNKNDFSAPVEHHRLLKSRHITFHASFHWHHKCHYEKLEHVIVMITWCGNADIGRKTICGDVITKYHGTENVNSKMVFNGHL